MGEKVIYEDKEKNLIVVEETETIVIKSYDLNLETTTEQKTTRIRKKKRKI